MSKKSVSSDDIVELNVGGVLYTTLEATLTTEPNSLLTNIIQSQSRDKQNRIFIDRDGTLFRYVLDYLRNKCIALPENFTEKRRLKVEAEYYKLKNMCKLLDEQFNEATSSSSSVYSGNETSLSSMANLCIQPPANQRRNSQMDGSQKRGYISIGYRGTFAFGREGLSDVKFRKISRILVCGRVQLCREVFGDALNESRDPDHGVSDRYTTRFYLKHTFLEQAFDGLSELGFTLVGTCATGANSCNNDQFNKACNDTEESRWLHYNEFIFYRN